MTAATVGSAAIDAPRVRLFAGPTPIEPMDRLREALGGGPRLFVKRDDSIPFGFGGNKVRKLEFVIARALAGGADTLVTLGGVQSNHARATSAAAAKLGLHCVLILNGSPPERLAANTLLDDLLGAEIVYITSRAERTAAAERVVARMSSCMRARRAGRRPGSSPGSLSEDSPRASSG